MKKGLSGLALIFLLSGGFLFIGTNFKRVKTIAVEVPYSEEVSYEVEVEYEEPEAYEVQVPYEGVVSVNKTEIIYENSSVIDYNGLFSYEVNLPNRTILIEWSSTMHLEYFAVMNSSRWDAIWQDFQLKYGVVVALTLLSGGILFPLAAYYFDRFIENCTEWVATPEDYYQQNSREGSAIRTVEAGEYGIVIFNTQSTNETSNCVDVTISGLYETNETQILYRNETRFRMVTKTRNETRYRTEEGIRLENKTVEQRLLELPESDVLSWNTIAASSIFLGTICIIIARAKRVRGVLIA